MTSERSLSDCAKLEEQSKAVMLLPRSGLPFLDLGGPKSQCQQTGTVAGDELEDPPWEE